MALNNVDLMGRLVADPEFRKISEETEVTSFRIAVDRDYVNKSTGNREADFINCVAFRGTAKFVATYFGKGDMIVVNGRLQTRTYQDQDGNNRSRTEVLCENCYFGSPKGSHDGSNQESQATAADIDDTDLPF